MFYNLYEFISIEIIYLFIFIFMKNNKIKKYICFFMLVLFSLYLGMRDFSIGADTQNYIKEYLSGNGGYFKETGFKYINVLLYKLKIQSTTYLIIISVINTILFYIGFKNLTLGSNEKYLVLYTFIFNASYLYGSINILRQSLASGFLLIAFAFFCKNKKFYSMVFIILGSFFHITVILFIGIIFFDKIYKNLKLNQKYILFLSTMIFSVLFEDIFVLYKKLYIYKELMEVNTSFYIKFILLIILYVLYTSFKKKNLYYEYFLFYGLCLLGIFINYKLVSGRLIYYINVITPIMIINLFKKDKTILIFLIIFYHIFVLLYPSTRIMFKMNNEIF